MHNDTKAIFQTIIDTRSLTVIEFKAEEALQQSRSNQERAALLAIRDTNDLDEAWAIAHEQLGHTKEAADLRQWLANKPGRRGIADWTGFNSPSHHNMHS